MSQTSLKRSPSSIPVNDQRSPSVSKRSRRESSRKSQAESEDIVEQGRNGHRPLDSENRGDTNDDNSEIDGDSGSSRDAMAIENTEVNEGGSGTTNSRPKRQATLNRLDYHALHHSIATPTGKWLELIHNPEKYGKTIKEGPYSY